MALLIKKNNHYVRFELDGTYYIYQTSTAREKEKKATYPGKVSAKY